MTYIDKLKCNNFTKGTDVHLKKPVLLVLIWFIGKLEVKKLMRSTSENIKPSIILGLVFAQIRKRKKHYHLLLGTLGKIFILKMMWLTNILKKMAWKIVVNEFDACYKFVDELKRYYCRNIDCSITHNVSSEDFVIFIDYNDSSTKAIERIIVYIKKHIQMSFIGTVERFTGRLFIKTRPLPIVTIKILLKLFLQLLQSLYRKFFENINGKNWVTDIVFKDVFVLIKVIDCRKDINPYKQLVISNWVI